jgi:hypothetical protein
VGIWHVRFAENRDKTGFGASYGETAQIGNRERKGGSGLNHSRNGGDASRDLRAIGGGFLLPNLHANVHSEDAGLVHTRNTG